MVFGYNGTGNLTVSNGATLTANGSDGNVGVHFGYNSGSHGNGLVTDANSTFTVNNGSVVIGNSGMGNLTIDNGGVANFTGFDSSNTSLILGNTHSGNGTLTVNGTASTLNVGNNLTDGPSSPGLVIIGNNGTGTLLVTNGGTVNHYGYDGNETSLILGMGNCAVGTLSVDGMDSTYNLLTTDTSWSAVVGYNGTGNISITNGGTLYSEGWDDSSVAIYVALNAGSTGTITIDGASGCSASQLTLLEGALILGVNGNGTLNVSNGGIASITANENGNFALTLGQMAPAPTAMSPWTVPVPTSI